MKYKHYAPKSPLVLLDGDVQQCINYISKQSHKNVAILSYNEDASIIGKRLTNAKIFRFGSKENEDEQARLLFKLLRDADKTNKEIIYAPLPRKEGVGLALFNRMIRASAHRIINLKR